MYRFVIAVVSALLAVGAPRGASAAERTPPGSYLIYRATTVGELRNQVAKNVVVRSRYTRHFGVSTAQLDSFLANNLSLVSLREPLRTKCWYIDRAGRQSVKTKLLPRGTMVFATPSGQPVLSWSCGNPLRADLPVGTVKSSRETTAKPAAEPEVKVLPNPMETISTAVVAAPPAPLAASALPVAAAPVLASAAAPAVSMPPVLSTSSFGGIELLGLLGGAAFAVRGGDHPSPPPAVVPEPSGLAAIFGLLVTLPGALCLRVKKRV